MAAAVALTALGARSSLEHVSIKAGPKLEVISADGTVTPARWVLRFRSSWLLLFQLEYGSKTQSLAIFRWRQPAAFRQLMFAGYCRWPAEH